MDETFVAGLKRVELAPRDIVYGEFRAVIL
jgi:hypothetical protein